MRYCQHRECTKILLISPKMREKIEEDSAIFIQYRSKKFLVGVKKKRELSVVRNLRNPSKNIRMFPKKGGVQLQFTNTLVDPLLKNDKIKMVRKKCVRMNSK